jgi:shikimate dehydrogenase
MKDRYAVFGNPIGHSKSPTIHQYFAEQTGQDMVYGIEQPETDQFSVRANTFFAQGAKGANVTAPFKLEAFKFADEVSPRAAQAGAVNTLCKLPSGKIMGDTTDGAGLLTDLQRQFGDLKGLSVLLLGAGGAARGVIGSLYSAGIASLCIANRSSEKALELADLFASYPSIKGVGLQDIPADNVDLIINSTSSSMTGVLPDIDSALFAQAKFVYDMAYKDELTSFLQWAYSINPKLRLSDGLGMLVGQAAESFYLWRGVRPNIEPVINLLRVAL